MAPLELCFVTAAQTTVCPGSLVAGLTLLLRRFFRTRPPGFRIFRPLSIYNCDLR